MATIEEVIIEMMPFPKTLKDYCKLNPDFSRGLKIIYYDKFIALQAVSTSYSPNFPNDEVIGIYVYDYGKKLPKFKQDFIVNIGGNHQKYILYTSYKPVINGLTIKHINEFMETYGKGGFYKNSHWPKIEDFNDQLKERALRAIKLAERRATYKNEAIPQDWIDKIYRELITRKPR